MEKLQAILWPIVLVGGLGALVDFLIGKAGQEKARDLLLKWWVRFDDVRWSNFGREEGLFAGHLIEKWFGRRAWSCRRLSAAIGLYGFFLSIGFIRLAIPNNSDDWCFSCHMPWVWLLTVLIMYFGGFCLSISLTKFLTFRMADLCRSGEFRNLTIFLLFGVTNYGVLLVWWPFLNSITEFLACMLFFDFKHAFILYRPPNISSTVHPISPIYTLVYIGKNTAFYTPDFFAFSLLSLFPNIFRVFLSIVFVGSFLLRPLVMRPVSLVWARIVESDKPVFTVIFGGAAAVASAFGEAAKHL